MNTLKLPLTIDPQYPHRMPVPPKFTNRITSSPHYGAKKAYKFMHSKYIKDVTNEGKVKIGSAYAYREIEKTSIRDENESFAITAIRQPVTGFDRTKVGGVASRVYGSVFGNQVLTNSLIEGMTFKEELPDVHMFCFSYECNREVVTSFSDNPPYDAVLEISNIFDLAEALSTYHPALKGFWYWCFPVIYCERVKDYKAVDLHPAENHFEKDLSFCANVEGRIVFIPPNLSPSPTALPFTNIVPVPELRRLFVQRPMP